MDTSSWSEIVGQEQEKGENYSRKMDGLNGETENKQVNIDCYSSLVLADYCASKGPQVSGPSLERAGGEAESLLELVMLSIRLQDY